MAEPNAPPRKSIILVGVGNIGSHAAPLLARFGELAEMRIIDPESYEEKNLSSMDVEVGDLGKPKAVVQAARLGRIRPALRVEAIVDRVENVPLAKLRGDVIVAGLDSRAARRYLGQAAWRLGVPWVDAAVLSAALLARISVFAPGPPEAPCYECSWEYPRSYQTQEQRLACLDGEYNTPATNGVACVGSFVGSLQAIEALKILGGRLAETVVGRQVYADLAHHQYYVTAFRRNPDCKFNHQVWEMAKAPLGELTIGRALDPGFLGDGRAEGLRVEGQAFVTEMMCRGCGRRHPLLRLEPRLHPDARTCPCCGKEAVPFGFSMRDELEAAALSEGDLARPLSDLGFQVGDVFTVYRTGEEAHVEIVGETV